MVNFCKTEKALSLPANAETRYHRASGLVQQPQVLSPLTGPHLSNTEGNIAAKDICFRSKQIKRDLIREFLSNSREQCLNPTAYSIRGEILVLKKDAVTPSRIVTPNYFFHLQGVKDEKSLRFKTSSSS